MLARLTSLAPLLAVALASCGDKSAPAASQPAAVADSRVVVALSPTHRATVERTVTAVGTLRGDVEVTVSTKLAGRVDHFAIDWGATIGGGEPLVTLETVDLELARDAAASALRETVSRLGLSAPPGPEFDPETIPAVRMARADLAHAENRLDRAHALLADPAHIVSVQDYEDLKNARDVAQAAVDSALLDVRSLIATASSRRSQLETVEQKLKDSVIRAPPLPAGKTFRVVDRLVEAGEYLKEGAAVYRLVVDDPLRFQSRVPERLAVDVAVGQDVTITADESGVSRPGKVSRVAPAADPTTRTVLVEVEVKNADRALVPGTFARGAIRVRTDPDVLFAPIDALVRSAGVTRVFTVDDGVARGHEVEVGARNGDAIEILHGLDGTPPLITSGAGRITPGAAVVVKAAADLGAPRSP